MSYISDSSRVFPFGTRRSAPEHFIAGSSTTWGWFPSQSGVVLQFRRQQTDLCRRRGSGGQRCQRSRVQAGDIGHVVKVDKLGKVAKFYSILGAHILVLVVVVFAKFGEA